MTFGEWAKAVAGTAREHLGVAVVSIVVIVAMGVVAAGSFTGCREQDTAAAVNEATTFPIKKILAVPTPTPESPTNPAKKSIIVYVTGAVKRPGVYTLPPHEMYFI